MSLFNILGILRSKKTSDTSQIINASIENDSGWQSVNEYYRVRDLNEMTRQKAVKTSHFLWRNNALARAIIEIPLNHIFGRGLKLSCSDEAGQEVLNKMLADPISNFDMKMPVWARECHLCGEQAWAVFRRGDGIFRFGYIDPSNINAVITDPDNSELPLIVELKHRAEEVRGRRYRILHDITDTDLGEKAREELAKGVDGECVYLAINRLAGNPRGTGDLNHLLDYIAMLDRLNWSDLERMEALRSYHWDVTLEGLTPEQIAERAKNLKPPRQGGIMLHSAAEKWEAKTPSLGASDTEKITKMHQSNILGGASLPEHWFGAGGDVNRATASEMAGPTLKAMQARQRIWGDYLESIGRMQLSAALTNYDADEPAFNVTAEFPELTPKDSKSNAEAFQTITSAASLAVQGGLLDYETATRLIVSAAEPLGIAIEADAVCECLEKSKQADNKADSFSPPNDEEKK